MLDDFANDEFKKFLGEIGIEIGGPRPAAQPFNLLAFRGSDRTAAARAVALSSPTAFVSRKRSASVWISAASKLSIERRIP
jgi:hypothetical protein